MHNLWRSFRTRKGRLRSGEVIGAVRGVSFAAPAGSVSGLLGPNVVHHQAALGATPALLRDREARVQAIDSCQICQTSLEDVLLRASSREVADDAASDEGKACRGRPP